MSPRAVPLVGGEETSSPPAAVRPAGLPERRAGVSLPPRSLYIHIPFCERRCEYCDFVSMGGREREREYMDALGIEIRGLAQRLGRVELDTVFVGGGTPSYVDPARLARLLGDVRELFELSPGAEVSLEANPSSVTRARARAWRAAGFTRVSLGIQSLEPDILAFLGRVHDARRAVEAVSEVRAAGFERVSCDLIYGVPGLDDARWRSVLERVVALGPGHVSAYELTVEPGTPLHARVRRGLARPVGAEVALRQHRIAAEVLGAAGLRRYEVSNHARPGEESRHNLVYWRRGHYLAAGLGAHGHIPAELAGALGLPRFAEAVSVRYWHGRSLPAYLAAPPGLLPIEGAEPVGAREAETERLMLGLRLAEGVELDAAPGTRAADLARAGLLWQRGGRVGATARGQRVLNEVIRLLAA